MEAAPSGPPVAEPLGHDLSQAVAHEHGLHAHPHDQSQNHSDTLDRIGAIVSFACAIHCVLVPIVVALPTVGLGWFTDARLENALAGGALLVAGMSAAWGFRKHRRLRIVFVFSMAAVLLIASRIVGEANWMGSALAVAGGLTLVGTHIYSHRLICSCHDHER